jgi:hypothetical protein|tara:strand:- start:133 stop:465 length:333 start_codon:yes stop_codon:yes gene_type:complete
MPYAVKKPHPTKADVMLYHTWDPDGDGYEEVRKFPDEAKANAFAAEHTGAVVESIGYEIDQTDEMIAERYAASIDPARPEGSVNISTNAESDHRFEPDAIRAFTAHGLLG